jgi:hypothetical protein
MTAAIFLARFQFLHKHPTSKKAVQNLASFPAAANSGAARLMKQDDSTAREQLLFTVRFATAYRGHSFGQLSGLPA